MADPSRRPLRTASQVVADLPPHFHPTFLRLAKELRAYTGRWGLFFLLYEQALDRDRVVDVVSQIVDAAPVVVAAASQHPDWLSLENAIATAAEGAGLVEVVGLDRWFDLKTDQAARTRLLAFNVRREAFSRRVAVPVLLWLRPAQLRELASAAPDVWSWRAGVHRFIEETSEDASPRTRRSVVEVPVEVDNRSVDERDSRIEELEAYIASGADAIEPRLLASLNGELASLLESIGEWERALAVRQNLVPLLESLGNELLRVGNLDGIATLLERRGLLDEALRIRQDDVLPVLRKNNAVLPTAVTMGKIADIFQARGQYDEALRIRIEEQLPVFERLGAVREKAITMGRIAEIYHARGDLVETLRIRREEELPVYERLGEIRLKAITMGEIAEVLQAQGNLDEALRIRQEEQIPVYERLGDVRSRAIALGNIADVLTERGQFDEALRIRREEELPVFERLGDIRSKAITMGQIADILQARGQLDEALRIRREEELPVYERLGAVREKAISNGRIADVLEARGEVDEALRIRRDEELPVYERLGDVRSRLITLGQIANLHAARGDFGEALRIWSVDVFPEAERLGDERLVSFARSAIDDIRGKSETASGHAAA